MPNLSDAVDTLIANGYSDDEIKKTVQAIRDHTDTLIKQNKTDDEIEGILSQTTIHGKDKTQRVPLFRPVQPTGPVRAENLSPEEKAKFRQQTEGSGLEEPSFLSELVNPINALTGGLNSLVARGVSRLIPNSVIARTPGVLREALDWQTMGASNLPSVAKNIYQGYKAAPKTMAEQAAKMEKSGARLVPGTNQVAPNITGEVDDIGRQIISTGKGTIGQYSDEIEREIARRGGRTPLETIENIRQSRGGGLALAEDLAEQAKVPDPRVTFNINNAKLHHLEGQLDEVTKQYNTLSRSIGALKEESRTPATNVLNKLQGEMQGLKDEITAVRLEQNNLMPVVVRTEEARKLALDDAIRQEETLQAGYKFLLDPPTSDKQLPHGPLPKEIVDEINEEQVRRGRQWLSENINPNDFKQPDIKGGFITGIDDPNANYLLPIEMEKDRFAKLGKQIVLDVGSTIRLENGNVGRIAGMNKDGLIRIVDKKGKEILVNPMSAKSSIIRNIAGEPEIINGKLKVGPIDSSGHSGLGDRKAFDKLDTPGLTRKDVETGDALASRIISSKSNGLSSLNDEAGTRINPQNGLLTNERGGGGIKGPTPSKDALKRQSSASPPVIDTLLYKARPTYRVALDFETKTGIPTFSKLYRYGREASDNYMTMKLDWSDRVDQIFKKEGLLSFTKGNKEAQNRISGLLEKIGTDDLGTAPGVLASRLGGNVKETRVAMELRKIYDEAFKKGAIDPEQYLQYYSPRRLVPDEPLFNFLKRKTMDYEPFFKHHRTGNLMPREENSLILAHRYFDSWSRGKYLNRWYEDVANPMLNNAEVIGNDTARKYFTNYMFDVMRYPRESAVETSDRMYTLVNNTIGKLMGNQQLADDIIKKFGAERMGEVMGDKLLSLQYKAFLGYRPIPALRNATQRIFAIPFLQSGRIPFSGEGNLLRGRALAATTEGMDKIVASGIGGSYQELEAIAERIGRRFTSPMHGYQKVELLNRGSIYLPIHDNILADFKAGKSLSEVSKHVNLHLYPELIQNEFKSLYSAGKVKDVREGLSDNAAHFLGDWAQLMTQFPYEKGGGPEWFRSSPVAKQVGAFQSWSLFTADYLSMMAKDIAKDPIGQRQKIYFLGKMFAYYTALDAAMEHALGISFHSNPVDSLPQTITGSPSAQVIEGLLKLTSSTARKMKADLIGERKSEYKFLDRQQAEGLSKIQNAFTPGIVRDINKITGEKDLLSSVKKLTGLD